MMLEGFSINELLYDGAGKPCDFRYLEVNPAFERYTGMKRTQIVGRTHYDLFPEAESLWIERFSKVVITGEPDHFEAWFEPLKKWFESSVYKTDQNKFAVIFYDVTKRKQGDDALFVAKEAAESATRVKTRFLNVAAHELRTPVTAFCILLQFSQMQLEKKGIPISLPILLRLRSQAERLSNLVIDLLEVSRLERGRVNLKRVPTDIGALIFECVENFKLQDPSRCFKVFKPDCPIVLSIDPMRIYQVLSNLLDNAIKYTPEYKPIEVVAEVVSEPTQSFVRVSVKDQGVGIPDAMQPLLFKPFSRGFSDQDESSSGLGLGLFISNSIIDLHGGKIRVKSKEGLGSTVYFELPRKAA
jgi:PAS domain S-box-containing protein